MNSENGNQTNSGSEPARLRATVSGRVQGVGFRQHTVRKAMSLGLTGWVANRWDGSVETVAEGPRQRLRQFERYLHEGPRAALVQSVDVTWAQAQGTFSRFGVRYER
jgi:acylphosphatase